MMRRGFAFFIFLIGMMVPVAGHCADAPPDDFDETAKYAKIILEKNPWVFEAEDIRVKAIAYIKTTSTRQYKCEISISSVGAHAPGHYRWVWIGYDEGSDRYYVDVVRSPREDFISESIAVVNGMTKNTVRLWESNTPRLYAKKYKEELLRRSKREEDRINEERRRKREEERINEERRRKREEERINEERRRKREEERINEERRKKREEEKKKDEWVEVDFFKDL